MEPDLQELLTAWMSGEVEPARYDQLLARIREDSEFRKAFVEEIRLLGMLKAVQSSQPRWLQLEDEIGWSVQRPTDSNTIEEAVARLVLDDPIEGRSRRRRRAWVPLLATAAALVLIGLGTVFSIATRRAAPGPQPAPNSSFIVNASLGSHDVGLAMILQLEGVRWSATDGPRLAVGEILKAGRLRLQSGRATLSMLNGVTIVVEGPADLDLVSVDQVFCRQGKLRTRVPEGAEGFVVSGPGTAVVDLGTEFAVNHTTEGRARGRVYQGMVEATVLSPAGTPQRSQLLSESKTFEINPGAGQIDKIEGAEQFAAPSDLAATPLTLDPAYPRAVLDSRPWGYWRFESRDENSFPNQVSGGLPLLIHGPIRQTTVSEGNRSIEFITGHTGQYLSLPEPWQPLDPRGYAVELWFLPTSIAHAALASLLTPADSNRHTFLLELTSRNRLTLHKPASIRFVHRLPPGANGGDYTFSDQYYIPYRWHHLVGQINGDQMEVFVDGNPSPPLHVAPGKATPAGQFLLGRLTTRPKHEPGSSRPFYGRIDEVAIYNQPLSKAEVQRHFQLASPRAGTVD
ncbi:Concanavalin A-like lectin/glucanases superfamily protein [Singulisphaera sp. GP187]|uniref:LamG-like jellyroll fold domain-containing protein n=1 Tax=Singulisphaera sp. GP187 TaxID=1882752 RepID=UPI00092CDAD2|nr:LamG-like jellyroll fold domain-containing protein [Singulisphaera sp. GP187]SIO59512.1 Concanavalin A-like lectin/glucanases superfamily protein [Singulisphaera sp. GP187]